MSQVVLVIETPIRLLAIRLNGKDLLMEGPQVIAGGPVIRLSIAGDLVQWRNVLELVCLKTPAETVDRPEVDSKKCAEIQGKVFLEIAEE